MNLRLHPLIRKWLQASILLFSYCCGNSICHSRGSGNPVFRSGPLLWVPARRGPSQGWHRRFSLSATDTI